MRCETWSRNWCPKCGVVNWLYCGDVQDQTVPDVDGVKCRSCGHVAIFDLDLLLEMGMDTDVENLNIEDGREVP